MAEDTQNPPDVPPEDQAKVPNPPEPEPAPDRIEDIGQGMNSANGDLQTIEQHVGEAQRFHALPDYGDIAYGLFGDLEYGIRWVSWEIKQLGTLAIQQDEIRVELEAQCDRLHRNCSSVRSYDDTENLRHERNELINLLEVNAQKLLQRSFAEVCREYRHPTSNSGDARKAPDTPATITDWYYQLRWQDRCFVLAMTVLQSAPLVDVTRSAKDLEETLKFPKKKKEDEYTASVSKLLADTHTKREDIQGTKRVFWQTPELIVRMLDFVAEQMLGTGPEHAFKEILQDWAQQDDSECSLRATRSLAFIMWQNERTHLRTLADTWANRRGSDGWFNAAILLAGAYEAERTMAERKALERGETNLQQALPKSQVLGWLEEWSRYQAPRGRRRAALLAYGILAPLYPELALDGMEAALQLLPNAKHLADIDVDTQVMAMITYANIAWNGQLHLVMARLAALAQRFTEAPRDTNDHRRDAERGLSIVFAAFFMTTVGAFGRDTAIYDLHEPLPEVPRIPDSDGHDFILAGLLSAVEVDLRRNLVMLLAAAIQGRQHENCFAVLRHWATITWDTPPDAELRAAYAARVVQIAEQLRQWDAALASPPPGLSSVAAQARAMARATTAHRPNTGQSLRAGHPDTSPLTLVSRGLPAPTTSAKEFCDGEPVNEHHGPKRDIHQQGADQ